MITYTGYLIIFVVILFIIDVIKKGPYINDSNIEYSVKIYKNKFNRNNLYINLGDSIDIENHDQYRHSFKIDNPFLKNSDILYQYDNYKVLFKTPGIYTIKSTLYDDIKPFVVHVNKPVGGVNFYNQLTKNIFVMLGQINKKILKLSDNILTI